MRQKRQIFQKQIRRQAINVIFKSNRQKYFNYSYNKSLNDKSQSEQAYQLIKSECASQLLRYSEQMHQGIRQENFQNLLSLVKDSYYQLKRLIQRGKESHDCLKFIVENWFKYSVDELLIKAVGVMQKTSGVSFNAIRKQLFKFAIYHYFAIFQYQIQQLKHKTRPIFNFLFMALSQLSNLPQSISQIVVIINSIIHIQKQARHQFFFLNNKAQQTQPTNTVQNLISFQNLSYVMFQNKQKFYHSNSKKQSQKYAAIKLHFILIFKEYGYELQHMKSYIEKCRKVAGVRVEGRMQGKPLDQVYETTLQAYGFPQTVTLKQFLDKEVLAIILETINEMKEFYLKNWSQHPQYQQNLADCLQAFRLFIQFYPSSKVIRAFNDQLTQLIDLLILKNFGIIVKNQILLLIDTIVFLDETNEITDQLIKYQDLFAKIWSYDEQSIFYAKLNIVNNLLLFPSGYRQVTRHLSQIFLILHSNRHCISLTLTFILNYLSYSQFSVNQRANDQLIIQLLYSLPGQYFKNQDIEKEVYILSHLYDNDFRKKLPERYQKWDGQTKQKTLVQDDSQNKEKCDLVSKMLDIYQAFDQRMFKNDMDEE